MWFSRLQMQGGTGKMRNKSGVATHDQFLCLYFSSSPSLFCSQFLFLFTVCLCWSASFQQPFFFPSILVRSWRVVLVTAQLYKFSGVELHQVPVVVCDPSRMQLNTLRGVKALGTATSIPGWDEPWSAGGTGRCRGLLWRASCREDRGCQVLFLLFSFGLMWQLSLTEIDLVAFCPNTLFPLPLLHPAVPVSPLDTQ